MVPPRQVPLKVESPSNVLPSPSSRGERALPILDIEHMPEGSAFPSASLRRKEEYGFTLTKGKHTLPDADLMPKNSPFLPITFSNPHVYQAPGVLRGALRAPVR